MKKILTLFFAFSLFNFTTKGQDSLSYLEFRLGMGVSNAGVNLYNQVGKAFNIVQRGIVMPSTFAGFGFNAGKLALEFGMDQCGQTNIKASNIFTIDMKVSNFRFDVKYSLLNTSKNQLNLLTDFNAQFIEFIIDSSNSNTKLFDLTSTTLEKDLLSMGLGLEYIYKGKMKKNSSFVYGARAGYNFYIHENPWFKGHHVKDSPVEYLNKDPGYLHAELFLGYRFYKR